MTQRSVADYIGGLIQPFTLDQVFEWPPDVFAVTSAILRATGAYRHFVSPPRGRQWPPELTGCREDVSWTDVTTDTSDLWLESIADLAPPRLPEWLDELKTSLAAEAATVTIEQLRDLEACPECWTACQAILCLHAIADSACRGFGTPIAPRRFPLIQFLADHLLATYGSLSRLPKASGIVLPKMRTPQTGLTLRASSLFVTWHQTEVEAVWRSTPWVNVEENTLNVLVLPWPTQIQSTAFRRNVHPTGLRSLGPNRYFQYDPPDGLEVDKLVRLVAASASLVSRIHMIVLPELAMSHKEFRDLQLKLADQLAPDRIPLIITGVRSWKEVGDRDATSNGDSCNGVVLSVYFADKWYDLCQDKHHRWKLDRRQVQQYTISGVLASDRSWWEDIAIPPRRLSILAPTGWLALCPLICEDLAQLEPVSELIRGIGPTLLVALLLDGPQLPSRWSARYASIMADDPGTSVLTVTSLGMAQRSQPFSTTVISSSARNANEPVTVALWRDAQNGFRELQLCPDQDGLIVTLSADWREEFSLDGRGDGGAAASFLLSGVQAVSEASLPAVPIVDVSRKDVLRGDQADLFELTTFAQLVDATLDANNEKRSEIISLARGEPDRPTTEFPKEVQAVVALIQEAGATWRTRGAERDFLKALDYFAEISGKFPAPVIPVKNASLKDVRDRIARLRVIVEQSTDHLAMTLSRQATSTNRWRWTKLAVLHNVLWAVHNRLEQMRRQGSLTMDGAQLAIAVQDLLAAELRFEPADLDLGTVVGPEASVNPIPRRVGASR